MLLLPLLSLTSSNSHSIPDFEIRRQSLNEGDTMSINDRGLTFLRIPPHFLPGHLIIATNTASIAVRAGIGYAFGPITLNLSYSAAAGYPCVVSVWKISSGCAHAIYSRYSGEAVIEYHNVSVENQICYFFDFPVEPTFEVEYANRDQPRLKVIQMVGENGYSRSDVGEGLILNRTFVVIVREYGAVDFRLRIVSKSPIVDWGDSEGEFLDCRADASACVPGDYGDFHMTVKRGIGTRTIVFVAVSVPVTVVLVAFLIFWNSGPDILMGKMNPLQSAPTMPID
jgi:hypothetical protein